ncbi:uncharacterized protein IL334_001881 [Kwoniella shivajii]|uniref:RING-type domain-containing protein n=1 Tax=Kwoniella shivajii TaxID=564305 RepID=A0ABZ1CW73_9TREE|nr:hypothetical protein IL334_001881 [Kwoniella shivajii]
MEPNETDGRDNGIGPPPPSNRNHRSQTLQRSTNGRQANRPLHSDAQALGPTHQWLNSTIPLSPSLISSPASEASTRSWMRRPPVPFSSPESASDRTPEPLRNPGYLSDGTRADSPHPDSEAYGQIYGEATRREYERRRDAELAVPPYFRSSGQARSSHVGFSRSSSPQDESRGLTRGGRQRRNTCEDERRRGESSRITHPAPASTSAPDWTDVTIQALPSSALRCQFGSPQLSNTLDPEGLVNPTSSPTAQVSSNDHFQRHLEEEMKCPICMSVMVAPHLFTPCGHAVCGICGIEWIRVRVGAELRCVCPTCRSSVDSEHPLIPARALESIIRTWIDNKMTTEGGWDGLAEYEERTEIWRAHDASSSAFNIPSFTPQVLRTPDIFIEQYYSGRRAPRPGFPINHARELMDRAQAAALAIHRRGPNEQVGSRGVMIDQERGAMTRVSLSQLGYDEAQIHFVQEMLTRIRRVQLEQRERGMADPNVELRPQEDNRGGRRR